MLGWLKKIFSYLNIFSAKKIEHYRKLSYN